MKKRLPILTLTAVMTASFASFAMADPSQFEVNSETAVSAPAYQQNGHLSRQFREKKMAARAVLLGLTDAQQSQIKAIIADARQANKPLQQKLSNDRKKVRELLKQVPFDEGAVRDQIASDESLRTDLTVSKIKVRNKIMSVLTPDQQVKAKQLRMFASNKIHKRGNDWF